MPVISRVFALFFLLPTLLPALYIEAEDPRVEARPAVLSNRKWVWALPGVNDFTRRALSNRANARGGTLVSSGWGFGNLGGGVGDAGFAGLAVKPVLRLPFSQTRSLGVHFFFHEQGHTARVVLTQGTKLVTNMTVETYAPSTLNWNDTGVLGASRPVWIAQGLNPNLPYVVEVSNLGVHPRIAQGVARTLVFSKAEQALGRGPQLLVDGFELIDNTYAFLDGVARSPGGIPFPQARVVATSSNGTPLGNGFTDGFGRFAFSALPPPAVSLTVETWPGKKFTQTVETPEGSNLQVAMAIPPTFEIIRPRTAVAFVGDAVGTLTVEVEGPEEARDFEARLVSPERTVTLPLITRPVYSVGAVLGDTRPGWLLQFPMRLVKPPADTWDLEVWATVGDERLVRRSARAVKILHRTDEPFTLFHVGDLHLTNATGRERAETLLSTLALVGGRLTVLGGDLGGRPGWAGDSHLVASFLEAPSRPVMVAIPGEADVTPVALGPSNALLSRDLWVRAVGPAFHELRWPGTYLLFCDGLSDPSRQIMPAWRRSQRDSRDDVRLLFAHDETWKPVSNEAPPRPDLFLTSHGRTNRLLNNGPFPVATTAPVDGSGPLGARMLCFGQDIDFHWRLVPPSGSPSVATKETRGIFVSLVAPDAKFPGGRPLVTRRFEYPNNGSATSNTVEIRNETPWAFPDAPVRFCLRRGSYQIAGPGELLSAYDSDDRSQTILCVKLRLAPSSVTRLRVGSL